MKIVTQAEFLDLPMGTIYLDRAQGFPVIAVKNETEGHASTVAEQRIYFWKSEWLIWAAVSHQREMDSAKHLEFSTHRPETVILDSYEVLDSTEIDAYISALRVARGKCASVTAKSDTAGEGHD